MQIHADSKDKVALNDIIYYGPTEGSFFIVGSATVRKCEG